MHSSHIEHAGRTWTIHHNGDFSGDARIAIDADRISMISPPVWPEDGYQVDIPIAVLEELIGRYLQSRAISLMEQLSGSDYLDSMVPG
jgi:hypothetical protein